MSVNDSHNSMIYTNSSKQGMQHMRPSSAIRHHQHQQQLNLKGQHASNIKIKGMPGGVSKHNHN
jgi:hypothetical protein